MRLSNLADYAVVILAAAARAGSARLNATCLAEETGVPLPTVQKLVGRLAGAGLIVSSRGTGGGFRLARAPENITLADIVEAVEGPIAMTACVEQGRHDCALETDCRVKPHWGAVNDAMKGALAGITLATLAASAPFPSDPEGRGPSEMQRVPTAADTNEIGILS
jgi:FeS assembly SUF system regulator